MQLFLGKPTDLAGQDQDLETSKNNCILNKHGTWSSWRPAVPKFRHILFPSLSYTLSELKHFTTLRSQVMKWATSPYAGMVIAHL